MAQTALTALGQREPIARERPFVSRSLFTTSVFILLFFFSPNVCSGDGKNDQPALALIQEDFTYVRSIGWADARSLAAAPLAVGKIKEITLRQVLIAAVVAGSIGGLIALDEDIRDGARDIDDSAASGLQNTGHALSLAGLAALYGAGLWKGDEQWRHGALTGGESIFLSFGLAKLAKVSFGRERPDAKEGAEAWFAGGRSFVSDLTTPAFAAAEAVSETFEHKWWVVIPAYAAATAVGVGRMGQDRHWASDVLASALLGIGTTRLLTALHRQHGQETPRLTFFPAITPGGTVGLRLSLRF